MFRIPLIDTPRIISRSIIILGIAAMIQCSCAAINPPKELGIVPMEQGEYHIDNVPFFQAGEMRCGPSAMAVVLAYYGLKADPDEIAPKVMESDKVGTYHQNLYLYALSRGMNAQMYSGGIRDLKRMVSMNRPVIILLDYGLPGAPSGHYVVVVGYDENNLYVHDGLKQDKKISRKTAFVAWARMQFMALLVLPPDTSLPMTSNEYIEQALTREENGEWSEAERLYRLALERDDINAAAMIGVGNARLHLDDPEGAVAWYKIALSNDSDRDDARVNMAAAYLELGKKSNAKSLIDKVLRKPDSDMRPYALDVLGDIYAAWDKKEEAVKAYREAIAAPPADDVSFVPRVEKKIENLGAA